MHDPTLVEFARVIAAGDSAPLARAALLMGAYARPHLEVDAYLQRLDDLAREVSDSTADPVAQIASLFGSKGLRGNADDFYDPRNSFLHDVLDRRLGIPISLSVVAIEVGRRLHIDVAGVPFPGHFLVRVRTAGEPAMLDPFAGGARLGDEDLLLRLRAVAGRIGSLGPNELGPASVRQILSRMMQNLKVIYLRKEQFELALCAQERLILIRPDAPSERRDRGLLLARLGRELEAEADLVHYLGLEPEAHDAASVRGVVEQLKGKRGLAN